MININKTHSHNPSKPTLIYAYRYIANTSPIVLNPTCMEYRRIRALKSSRYLCSQEKPAKFLTKRSKERKKTR